MPLSSRSIVNAAVALAILSASAPAHAHFMWLAADDPVKLWLGRQHDANGSYCCDGTDAFIYDGPHTINADGSVTIPLPSGELKVIDPYKVLPFNPADPNPTGQAVWWHSDGYGSTYCFALGPLT